MENSFSLSKFLNLFPDNNSCLEEIKRQRFSKGMWCVVCKKITHHYKLKSRTAYSCTSCRNQLYPLAGTVFEKTTTPLRLWFYAMFLMTHTRAGISTKQLQRELGVTYKTAWRIAKQVRHLMSQNNGDLLSDSGEVSQGAYKVRKWTIFNKLEITLVQKQTSPDAEESEIIP